MSHVKLNFATDATADFAADSPSIAAKSAVGAATNYTLECRNDSIAPWVFYVYQTMPQQPSDVFSLAWFASPYKLAKGAKISFTWSIDYSFVWGNSGVVMPGVNYQAGAVVPCDLTGANQTTFSYNNNTPDLSTPVTGGQAGSLTVNQSSTVPNAVFGTGIGMSGQGAFVQQALANAPQIYTPTPKYWIAAATSIQMGVVLAQTITQNAQITFPSNTYKMYATLSDQQIWTVDKNPPPVS